MTVLPLRTFFLTPDTGRDVHTAMAELVSFASL